jgi:hypothetical protein
LQRVTNNREAEARDLQNQLTTQSSRRLYQAMLGPERLAPAAALRAAQIALWKEKGGKRLTIGLDSCCKASCDNSARLANSGSASHSGLARRASAASRRRRLPKPEQPRQRR